MFRIYCPVPLPVVMVGFWLQLPSVPWFDATWQSAIV